MSNENTSLFAGDAPTPHRVVTLAAGAALKRGTVLGRVTATGHYVTSVSAANDGSEVPQPLVLAYDVPVRAAPTDAAAYGSGEFTAERLTFGAGHTAATVEAAWRAAGHPTFIKSVGDPGDGIA